jgi:hypothetical protein
MSLVGGFCRLITFIGGGISRGSEVVWRIEAAPID